MTEQSFLPDQGQEAQDADEQKQLPQNSLGRAFAGITLVGAAFMLIGPHMAWLLYGSDYEPVTLPFTLQDGMPSDATFATGIGFVAGCVGGIRLATRVPLAVRVTQIVLAGWMMTALFTDWSRILDKGWSPGGGLVMVMAGTAMVLIGGFPLSKVSMPRVRLGRQSKRAALMAVAAVAVAALAVAIVRSGIAESNAVDIRRIAAESGAPLPTEHYSEVQLADWTCENLWQGDEALASQRLDVFVPDRDAALRFVRALRNQYC